MTTIEERANKYIGHPYEIDEDTAITMARKGYVRGATEQEAIDEDHLREVKKMVVDKACEWLERANSALPPCYKMFEVNIENFRKSMEE